MAVITQFDLDVLKMKRQGGCCTTVVEQNEMPIHQKKTNRKAYQYAIISMQNEPYPFLSYLPVVGSMKFATYCYSQLFCSQFYLVKI